MVYDPARVAEPAGRAHWPLDANVDVVVAADTVSKNLNDLKVSIPRAGLYPILSHLGHISTETQTSHTPTLHSTVEQPGHPQDPHRDPDPQPTSCTPISDSIRELPDHHQDPHRDPNPHFPNIIQHMGIPQSPLRSTQRTRPTAHLMYPNITQHSGTTWSPLRFTQLCYSLQLPTNLCAPRAGSHGCTHMFSLTQGLSTPTQASTCTQPATSG